MVFFDALADYFFFAVTEDGRKLFLPSGKLDLGMAAINIGLSSIPFAMLLFAQWREAPHG